MDIHNFDIAFYTGHKAIEELSRAYQKYVGPIAPVLEAEGVRTSSFDFKENHDIEVLVRRQTVSELDIDGVDPINAFHWGGFLMNLRKKEAERCINAAIFFQAMMEAAINDALGDEAEGSFAMKWRSFLEQNGASEQVKQAFEDYLVNIYRKIRIPAVHAKKRIGGRGVRSS